MSTAQRTTARNLAAVKKLERNLAYCLRNPGRADLAAMAEHLSARLAERLAGRCRVCHRTLTDPDSIAAGIGPECASK